jgi:predicted enzyme related to lactoylglutathione lyase
VSTATKTHITGMDANYYFVEDFDRAFAFYSQTLGLTPTIVHAPMFAEFTFPGGETFGLYKSDQYEHGSGVMFAVSDVKEAVADLKAKGVSIVDHIEDTPGCYMAFAHDSEGNSFILHQRK